MQLQKYTLYEGPFRRLVIQISAATIAADRLMPRWQCNTVGSDVFRARRNNCSGAATLSALFISDCQCSTCSWKPVYLCQHVKHSFWICLYKNIRGKKYRTKRVLNAHLCLHWTAILEQLGDRRDHWITWKLWIQNFETWGYTLAR